MKYSDAFDEMTIQEKCDLCSSPDCLIFPGVPRLKVPALTGLDGPQGVRFEDGRTATALPCNLALAATFDKAMAREYGQVIGRECAANNCRIIYGPGINLMRTPMNGRNFEYMGEDPVLAGKIAAGYVTGCQSEKVAACPKHLALNNQEICRTNGSSNCTWSVIRKLYLEAFRIIIAEASPWCIMSSYNRINGEFASQCGKLQQEILKDEWLFDGVIISDAGAVHDGVECFRNGLDAELGSDFYRKIIPDMISRGELPVELLDDKVRRMLRLIERTDGADQTPYNALEHSVTARRCAVESIVMLKNHNNILPLNEKIIRRILITGPAADSFQCIGTLERRGGSGAVHPPYEITPLAGMRNYNEKFEIIYMPCFRNYQEQLLPSEALENMTIRYFDLSDGELIYEESVRQSSFHWGNVNAGGVNNDHPVAGRLFRAEISGRICPSEKMQGKFAIFDSRLNARLRYLDVEVQHDSTDLPFTIIEKGDFLDFTVVLEHNSDRYVELTLLWHESSDVNTAAVLQAASEYDAVIYFGGRTHMQDREALGWGDVPGADIGSWALPDQQDEFITDLCKANRQVIGVFNTGGPFDLRKYHDKIAAILISYYPGMEGGNAVADIICGKAEPGGRLPFTWCADLNDYACHANGTYPGTRSGDDPGTDYSEGEFIGYRYADKMRIKALYPFGYGMGYTTFVWYEPELFRLDGLKIVVPLENTGGCSGSEVVQLYGCRSEVPADKPKKELIDFTKVNCAVHATVGAQFTFSNSDIEKFQQQGFTHLLICANADEIKYSIPLY